MSNTASPWMLWFVLAGSWTLAVVVGYLYGRVREERERRREWAELDRRDKTMKALRDLADECEPIPFTDWWAEYKNVRAIGPRGGRSE